MNINTRVQINNFIHLIQGSLKVNTIPELESPDWQLLFRLSKQHNVVTLGYESISRLPVEKGPLPEFCNQWKYENDQCIFQCMYQQAALDELKETFEREEIPIILLKGSILRDYYPREDLRTMADLDILIRKEDLERIRIILSSMGYHTESVDSRNEDVYIRDGCVTLEVHRELFWKQDEWNEYFRHVWDRTEKISGYNWIYKMNPQDFYFHLLGHMIHHMQNGGIGIKAFLDLKIFRKRHEEELEQPKFKELLKTFHLEKLDDNLKRLFRYWSGEIETDNLMEQWTEFIINSGAYGEVGNFIITNPAFQSNRRKKKTFSCWHYIGRRLFPSYEELQNMYPKMKKPFYFFYIVKRIYKNGIRRRKIVKKEFHAVKKLDTRRVTNLNQLYNNLGIPQDKTIENSIRKH